MAVEKFNETYETIYDKKDDFFTELEERCANTSLYKIKPDSVKFYAGEVKDNAMHLRHIVGNSVKTIPMILMLCRMRSAMMQTTISKSCSFDFSNVS